MHPKVGKLHANVAEDLAEWLI